MSIQTELTRITNAKAAIKTAIEGKGVTVPSGTLIDGMAALIESIEAGGGGDFNFDGYIGITKATSGTYTVTNNSKAVYIPHGLGEIPKIVLALPEYDSSVTTNYRGFGCFSAVLPPPSNDKCISCTFRVNGTNSISGGTITEFKNLSSMSGNLSTAYATELTSYRFAFGSISATNDYYTILAGTTFHWIAMA